jgi:hypothetical protein
MSADSAHVNTPAAAWAWLTRKLSDLDQAAGPSINREWTKFRSDLDGRDTPGTAVTDWPSDFWIAKTQRSLYGIMVAVWAIPERLDQWTTLEMKDPAAYALPGRQETSSASFLELLARTDVRKVPDAGSAARRFMELAGSSVQHKDQAMISTAQIRAWLATAFGDLLGGIALTPIEDDRTREIVVQEVARRIAAIDSPDREDRKFDFLDYGCDALYNTHVTPSGIQPSRTRQGQGTGWQQYWRWLSTPQDAAAMKATLQLAGLLLINEPLLAGLDSAIRSGNEGSQKRALCVARRWLLTAKVLAWLSEALQHTWAMVTPADLACFAFAAMSPAWPRRTVAVSHRSADVKMALSGLTMWKSPHVAIDASYVPAWETNTGMIWNLFAPVPLIVRVKSPGYLASEWCRRENEIFQYLIDHADFLEGRAIADVGVDKVTELDTSLFQGGAPGGGSAPAKSLPAPAGEFPLFSLVLVSRVPAPIDLAILRAAGALRLINLLVRDPVRANKVASDAAAGEAIDMEPPTNNPDGWTAYGAVFRDLEAAAPPLAPGKPPVAETPRHHAAGQLLSLRVPDDYPALDVEVDRIGALQIPDLSDGQYRLADVLAALEWQRTVLTWFMDEDFGDKIVVDLVGYGMEDWTTLADFSLARGLLALNSLSPTWIMQQAGQNAHLWSGFRENPIFTSHIDDQFSWLKPVITDPSWLLYYLANAGLDTESNLQVAIIASVAHSATTETLEVQREGGNTALRVPEPRSFFQIPTDSLADISGKFDIPLDSTPIDPEAR